MNGIRILVSIFLLSTASAYGDQSGIYHRTYTASRQSKQIKEMRDLLEIYNNDRDIPPGLKVKGEELLGMKIWGQCKLEEKIENPMLMKDVDVFDLELFGSLCDSNLYLKIVKEYLTNIIQQYGSRESKQALQNILSMSREANYRN